MSSWHASLGLLVVRVLSKPKLTRGRGLRPFNGIVPNAPDQRPAERVRCIASLGGAGVRISAPRPCRQLSDTAQRIPAGLILNDDHGPGRCGVPQATQLGVEEIVRGRRVVVAGLI